MSAFTEVLQCTNSDEFAAQFRLALSSLDVEQLSLQQAVKNGSIALNQGISVMIISHQQTELLLEVKVGIFFRSMIAGCNCADDPSPVDTLEEYAEAWFYIDRRDASFTIKFD